MKDGKDLLGREWKSWIYVLFIEKENEVNEGKLIYKEMIFIIYERYKY